MKNRLISIGIVCLIVIGGFVGLVNFGSEKARGATFVSGIIYDGSGGPWTPAGNPYIVVGDVTVPAGETLTIEPGVEVKFDDSYNLIVDGSLMAIGNETGRINITSNKVPPGPFDWRGIEINSVVSTDHAEIKYCDISYAGIGIVLDSSSDNIITNSTFSNNSRGIHLWYSSNNTLTNNTFTNEGVYISGDQLSHFNTHTIPDNNMVNGKPLYYYKNQSGIDIDGVPVGQLILANCTDVDVKNIQINNTDKGINVAYSTNILIANNNISSNDGGISLMESSNNNITNNIVSNNGGGIVADFSSNNTITNNNVISNNGAGIYFGSSSSNNIITSNNILSNDLYGIFLDLSSNSSITKNYVSLNNRDGIFTHSSSNSSITGNYVSLNNWNGITIYSSSNSSITNNYVLANNDYGIVIWLSSNNSIITGNNVKANSDYGIGIYSSSNNNITNNYVSSTNGYGIYLESSSNNRIYHNNIINNDIQAFDDRNDNIWNDSYPSGGNYWSDFDEPSEGAYDDYQGPEQDDPTSGDGIVDNGTGAGGGKNPYEIDSDSRDNYPLLRNYISLYEGWNLISIPFIQSDTNLGSVLSSITGSYSAVQWYNISDNSDHWKHHQTSKPSSLNDLDDIDHTKGFWIYITEPGGVLFEYFGVKPTQNQTITLHPGWNMVGYPSLSNKNRTAALNNITFGQDVDSIWTYNAEKRRWEEIGEWGYFEVGRGYWIHATQECVWDVPL